mgnify:CR=1 FL=1
MRVAPVGDAGSLVDSDNPDFDLLEAAFLASLDVRQQSLRLYRWAIRRYFRWVRESGRRLGFITRVDLLEYKRYLSEYVRPETGKTLTAQTVNTYIIVLRLFYAWTLREGKYPNIAYKLKGLKCRDEFVKQPFKEAQLNLILENCLQMNCRTVVRDYAILSLLIYTGIREIEAIRAVISDRQAMGDRTILWVQGKGRDRKDNWVVLPQPAIDAIDAYLATRPDARPNDPLFVTQGMSPRQRNTPMTQRMMQGITKKYIRAVGIDFHEYSGHSFRHSAARMMMREGASLFDVQNVLRHSNPATTQRYLRAFVKEERLDSPKEDLIARALGSDRQ